MKRLHETLIHRAGRGTPVGADTMIDRVTAELRGQEAPKVVALPEEQHVMTTQPTMRESTRPPTPPRRPRWHAAAAFGAAFLIVLGSVGVVALLPNSEEPVADTTAVTVTTPPSTTLPTTTTVEPTTTPIAAAPGVIPELGEAWEIVLSTRPGDTLLLELNAVFPTGAGYYAKFLDVETYEYDWHLMTFDGGEQTLVDVNVPASASAGGFVTGGPGVVAWTNVGPESRTDAQLWVSSDGIDFGQVAEDLLAGCEGISDCQGTQIYSAAASPAGRVVALAYDPLVWNAACECSELNPVALVSDDGYVWTRHPLDLLSVLPPEWQGAAEIRSPLVYVDGRWLTYATHYYNNCYCTDTAFFASENGIDWQLVDTGELFDDTYLMGMASNDSGVVVIMYTDAYWSPDGIQWSRSVVTSDAMLQKIAAYDNGYVAVGSSIVDEGTSAVGSIDRIWYSPDGTAWTQIALELEEATYWNALVGDGPNLVAVGGAQTNLGGIWRWSE